MGVCARLGLTIDFTLRVHIDDLHSSLYCTSVLCMIRSQINHQASPALAVLTASMEMVPTLEELKRSCSTVTVVLFRAKQGHRVLYGARFQ